jgi:hypothetical protein
MYMVVLVFAGWWLLCWCGGGEVGVWGRSLAYAGVCSFGEIFKYKYI